MSSKPLPKLKGYFPTSDNRSQKFSFCKYERIYPNGWNSSAEVKAREQAIVQRLKDILDNYDASGGWHESESIGTDLKELIKDLEEKK